MSSAFLTSPSTAALIWLTRCPTSRFASFGAAFNQRSLTSVSTPFLRAIQRSRKVFQSASFLTDVASCLSAASSFSTALSSAASEKLLSLGTLYINQLFVLG